MTSPSIYGVRYENMGQDDWVSVRLENGFSLNQDWWTCEVMAETPFEQGRHTLVMRGPHKHQKYTSDDCQDLDRAYSGVWAFSEKAWDWLPALEAAGARIAPDVQVDGSKRYRLVFPGPVLDLLDHVHSDIGYIDGAPDQVRKHYLYEWNATPPPLFRLWRRGSKKSGSSMDWFVSQQFVDEYRRRDLTGMEFVPMERTRRPADAAQPFDPVLFWPPHARRWLS